MSRTPLFAALRRHFALARLANQPQAPALSELLERAEATRWTRRRFVTTSTLAGLAALTGCAGRRPPVVPTADGESKGPGTPRIAIVGAGIAGLNAGWKLSQAGLKADLFEAASRTGGRMLTAQNLFVPGHWTELGGEFIDSNHEEMLALVDEFNLELLDTQAPSESELIGESYLFGGQMRSTTDVIEAFREVAARMKADFDALEETIDFEHEGGAAQLDKTSIAEYLKQRGATGWLADLLEVAYVTEYGLDAGDQSALNLLLLIGTDVSAGFDIFGESDERYKVKGGNQRVVDELAARLDSRIHREHRLLALHPAGAGYRLIFAGPNQATVEVVADVVLLTLPFTLLRDVEIKVDLPAIKRHAIAELGYGTNAKVMAGVERRVWREQGANGGIFSDQAFQLGWDNSQFQPGPAGGFTFYSGGRAGLTAGEGTAEDQVRRLITGVNQAWPGTTQAWSGKASRIHWPTFKFSRGSYACYRPGQWTTIAGAEGRSVGRLLFAGEHCSSDFQGFMNGGAETGKTAAAEILAAVGRSSARFTDAHPSARVERIGGRQLAR